MMARKPHDKLPTNPADLDGMTKAAILLLALGPEPASAILKLMEPEQVQEVTRELAGLGRVPAELQAGVVSEFYHLSIASEFANEGNLEYAKAILKDSMDPTTEWAGMVRYQVRVVHGLDL